MAGIPSLNDDPKYKQLTTELRTLHGVIRARDYNNPGELIKLKDDLGQLRLGANLLFSFINRYIDVLSELQQAVAAERQGVYEAQIALGKSPSASESHARETTRTSEAQVKVVENRISQMKNEYERYNGIAMYLQSRMKEANTERIMG
jgi:hypothetical protein